MVRPYLYILLAIITFQLSWNVLTGYCMHETGRAANHFGHHQHNTSADELSVVAKDKPDATKKVVAHDAHCASYVHLALAVPDLIEPLTFARIPELAIPQALVVPGSAFSSPPERPQWTGRA
jgi:hypothetical protein